MADVGPFTGHSLTAHRSEPGQLRSHMPVQAKAGNVKVLQLRQEARTPPEQAGWAGPGLVATELFIGRPFCG